MLKNILEAKVAELWKLYEATGELGHPGEKGLLRELFLRNIIECVLPPHFGVGSGVIVDKWHRQSPQIDLLIYDRRRIPPFLEQGGHGIYPFDAVLRVIEVKSILNNKALKQFMKLANSISPRNPDGLKIASVGKLENGSSYYPFATLFAYKSDIKNIKVTLQSMEFYGDINTIHTFVLINEHSMVDTMRSFLVTVLEMLEVTAASRKEFSLIEWLG